MEDRECAVCDGTAVFTGRLGHIAWFRCRHCGMEQCAEYEAPEVDEEDFTTPQIIQNAESKD